MLSLINLIEKNNIWITIALVALIIFILIFLIYLWRKIKKIEGKSKTFLSGKDGKDLEQVMIDNAEAIKSLDEDIQELYLISNKIHALANKSLFKLGVIRFNPFKDIGGDQSFSVAFLDGKNSGVVLSSLHTREGTRVYAKPITEGQAEKYPLTEEEKQAIKIASPNKTSQVG